MLVAYKLFAYKKIRVFGIEKMYNVKKDKI